MQQQIAYKTQNYYPQLQHQQLLNLIYSRQLNQKNIFQHKENLKAGNPEYFKQYGQYLVAQKIPSHQNINIDNALALLQQNSQQQAHNQFQQLMNQLIHQQSQTNLPLDQLIQSFSVNGQNKQQNIISSDQSQQSELKTRSNISDSLLNALVKAAALCDKPHQLNSLTLHESDLPTQQSTPKHENMKKQKTVEQQQILDELRGQEEFPTLMRSENFNCQKSTFNNNISTNNQQDSIQYHHQESQYVILPEANIKVYSGCAGLNLNECVDNIFKMIKTCQAINKIEYEQLIKLHYQQLDQQRDKNYETQENNIVDESLETIQLQGGNDLSVSISQPTNVDTLLTTPANKSDNFLIRINPTKSINQQTSSLFPKPSWEYKTHSQPLQKLKTIKFGYNKRSRLGKKNSVRVRKNSDQHKLLEFHFTKNPNWNKETIKRLSEETGLSESQVYKWNWDFKCKLRQFTL